MNTVADSELSNVVRVVYESHNDRPTVSPAWLATEAMAEIGFPRDLHPLGYIGCHLQIRQIARAFCRKHFDPEESVENDLFPETLQQRYPRQQKSPEQEPEYVLLDLLSRSDIVFNIDRLRKEARSKLKHADALEAWSVNKFGRAPSGSVAA